MIRKDVKLGRGVKIFHPTLVTLFGCTIGSGTKIHPFVVIQQGVRIGKNCKIEPFVFIPEGVTIEDGVFIGPHVCFTNDRYPKAVNPDGSRKGKADWKLETTVVKRGASIGAGSIILPGVTIGKGAIIGAGSVVTKNIPAGVTAIGNPARLRKK